MGRKTMSAYEAVMDSYPLWAYVCQWLSKLKQMLGKSIGLVVPHRLQDGMTDVVHRNHLSINARKLPRCAGQERVCNIGPQKKVIRV